MHYEIIEDQIHIYLDNNSGAAYVLWPEELIKIAESLEGGEKSPAVAVLAALLSTVLEEHPEVFACHYHSDVIT